MRDCEPFVDIHCHLLPDLDDGAQNWLETTQMARMAVADGLGASTRSTWWRSFRFRNSPMRPRRWRTYWR